MFMITPTPVVPLKPGSGTRVPSSGRRLEIVDEAGKPVADGEEGYLVLNKPWPAMLPCRHSMAIRERYVSQYWSKYPGKYMTGDSGQARQGWLLLIIGRVDDVIQGLGLSPGHC